MRVKGEGGRERTGYEPFVLHAPIQWAVQGYVTAEEGVMEAPMLVFTATVPLHPTHYNLLVQIHSIIELIWWTGLAPWVFSR